MLVLKERAEILELGEGALHSERLVFERPCVIRLIRYVRIPRDVHRRKITRKAVLARDAWTCQYCGRQAAGLTVDHVIPRSRGGESVWENIVASCAPCNRKKGNLTPREARMHPRSRAAAPGPDRVHPSRQPADPDRLGAVPGRGVPGTPERRAAPKRRPFVKVRSGKRDGNWRRGGTCSPPSQLAGARGGFAGRPAGPLAALHLRCPEKHVTQVRTTSFLRSPD